MCLYLLITIMAQVQAVQAVPNVATVTAIRRADQVSGHIDKAHSRTTGNTRRHRVRQRAVDKSPTQIHRNADKEREREERREKREKERERERERIKVHAKWAE